MTGDCPWCGEWSRFEIENGHYICPRCRRAVDERDEKDEQKNLFESGTEGRGE